MAFGFKKNRSKVEVYAKDEVYNKTETYSKNEVYNKEEVYSKNEVYKKDEIDNKVTDKTPIGSGMDYFGTVAPDGYLFADGSAISRTQYKELFEIIGTIYGSGDGSTTFNLPDKRERVSVMYSSSSIQFNAMGKKVGSDSNNYNINHDHQVGTEITNTDAVSGEAVVSKHNFTGNMTNNGQYTNNLKNNNTLTVSTIQKSLVCNYIIKVK